MTSFSGLGIGLSLVFGCLLLALAAELYYVLCWKKRIPHRQEIEDDYGNYAKEYLIQLFCWKKPSSLHSNNTRDCERDHPVANAHEPDPELGTSKDLLLKAFGEEGEVSELMRLHNLVGPPRFLFTIKEETKEDLESDDGKSRGDRSIRRSRTRSLSDLMVTVDSPFLTPLASPTIKSATLNGLDSYHHRGFNPLFESSTEAELNGFRSSPPPKFKFLRDAEEKLLKRLMVEEAEKMVSKEGSAQDSGVKTLNTSTLATVPEVREGSFLKFIVGHHLQQYPSSTSQVLPLASSPTTFRPPDQKSTLH
ncbi:Transmembrane protein [Melia azedarach]|uniref:Transmembrane protein n=2 Tax=Melia azedarach TaxID=155640 RepID=A0ACC1YS10_MELAZ|nr:Transmembrane protein [Melia azedarach]KAJ4725834.1 Transmembrane protein [Melia azedarach]